MKMAKVTKCEVNDCVYNKDHACHTLGITVGDGCSPDGASSKCDTFCGSTIEGGNTSDRAGVGACKVMGCAHNTRLECMAPGINVGYRDQTPYCLTFGAK